MRKPWGRIAVGICGLLLFALAAWRIGAAREGLAVVHLAQSSPPITFIYPKDIQPGSRPLVLIGHGFAGSANLMEGFALTFAQAGYVTALWDFAGHGTNPEKLDRRIPGRLQQDAEAVLAEADRRGLAAVGQTAILGHSMGSGVALGFGQVFPETRATIAISPVRQGVTQQLPQNLLLMVGSLEGGFVSNAHSLLAEAGGEGGSLAEGTARKLVVIPGVEHISILFKPQTHAVALEWLDGVFGEQPGRRTYTDLRIAWYGLGVLGMLVAACALVPTVERGGDRAKTWWRRTTALFTGALGSTLLLWLAEQGGMSLSGLFGIQVGGYLLVWFGLAGILAWMVLGELPGLPSRRALVSGLLVFAALWAGVGLLGNFVWVPWWLYPQRLALWLPGALLTLPWFLAAGAVIEHASLTGRLGWWLAQVAAVCGSLLLALALSQGLFFLVLILPTFPLILGFHALATIRQGDRWAIALGGALFTGWLLLAVFPLS